MDETSLTRYILDTFPGVEAIVASGGTFFIYDPDRSLPPERKFPFATLVVSDEYDRASHLDRPGVFRLNVGVSKETYQSLFGPYPPRLGPEGVVDTGHDFTVLDQILPHPVYAPQSWICVLNPGEATFQAVQPLLAEAYERSVRKYRKPRTPEES